MAIAKAVRISPKAKRVYLQRYLLAKFVYKQKDLLLKDLCCLFENQLWLEWKCYVDPEFNNKFGKDLETLSGLLKEFNFRTKITTRTFRKFAKRLQENLTEFILPVRNYEAARKQCNGLFQLEDSKPLGVSRKRIPPKTFIGKGYRDKGSAKDVAKDGSPSWQEVATHRGPIYHGGEPYEESKTNGSSELDKLKEVLERTREPRN